MLCNLFDKTIVVIHAHYDLIELYFSFEDTNKERGSENLIMPCGHGLKAATIFTQILKAQLILIFSHCRMIH